MAKKTAKKTAKMAKKQNAEVNSPGLVGYAGGYKPTAAELKRMEAERRRYERENRRTTAINAAANVHAGTGKPAAQILREADAIFAWLNAGYGK